MRYLAAIIAAGLCAAPVFAQEQAEEPGQPEPWEDMSDLGPGDLWAELKIDIDKKGKPTKCVALRHNIAAGRAKRKIWHMCRGVMYTWHTEPVLENGEPVATSVTRVMVLANSKTTLKWDKAKSEYEARKRAGEANR